MKIVMGVKYISIVNLCLFDVKLQTEILMETAHAPHV